VKLFSKYSNKRDHGT